MDLNDIGVVVPMGLMVTAHVTPIDHIYFSPVDYNSGPYAYNVYAPADGYIVSIGTRTQSVGVNPQALAVNQYRIYIQYTCTFYTIYDLVTQLDPAITAITGPNPNVERQHIPVKQGQLIGKIGGQTLDINVVDLQTTLPGFINPADYNEPWKVHSVDPFPHFALPLQDELLAKDPRIAPPRGGKIDYDIAGKIVGNWFQVGTNGEAGLDPTEYWAGHLAIAYDLYDPTKIIISIGSFKHTNDPEQFGVIGNAPDPATVDLNSGMVKYTLTNWSYVVAGTNQAWDGKSAPPAGLTLVDGTEVDGVLLAQLQANGQLKVEAFPGADPATVTGFTDAAILYER